MKSLHFLLLIPLIILFSACNNDDENPITTTTLCSDNASTTLTLDYNDGITLEFPDCFELTPLQGIDSYVGKIEAVDEEVLIFFDIGPLAGEYVKESDSGQVTVQGDSEVFRHALENDVLTFTFSNAGPANFYTRQPEHRDDLVEFFKTLKIL